MLANGPVDLGSIPVRVIPKTLKMVLDTALLNTQQYKVCIKVKVEKLGVVHLGVVAIEKEAFWSPSTTVANFTLYFSSYLIRDLRLFWCHQWCHNSLSYLHLIVNDNFTYISVIKKIFHITNIIGLIYFLITCYCIHTYTTKYHFNFEWKR